MFAYDKAPDDYYYYKLDYFFDVKVAIQMKNKRRKIVYIYSDEDIDENKMKIIYEPRSSSPGIWSF